MIYDKNISPAFNGLIIKFCLCKEAVMHACGAEEIKRNLFLSRGQYISKFRISTLNRILY